MAKTKGPLLSLDAHGSLSKLLTYSNKRTGQQVRKYNKPLATPSAKQRGQRRLTEFLVAQWQNMSAGTKATWETNAKASRLNLPGYQYFLSKAQKDLYTHHGLVGFWHCNEIIGGKVLDISGSNNSGTLGPSYPSNAPRLVAGPSAKFGRALKIDGVDEWVDMGNPARLKILGPMTIIMLVKLQGTTAELQVPLGKLEFDAGGYRLKTATDGANVDFQAADTGDTDASGAGGDLPLNQWALIAGVFTGAALRCHVDYSYSSNPTSISKIGDTAVVFVLGNDTNKNRPFFGVVDDVCVYNRALSIAEINARVKFSKQ